ncbi:MAG: hypothetical protein WD065_18490 [Planctomycetaceae bacterium]
MLTIATDILPQTCLSYLAFRISFMETLERITLARQVGGDLYPSAGYLTEVPFYTGVPAHIQLDLLATTWAKHLADETIPADLVDESVVYAVCETAARISETQPEIVTRYLKGGPLDIDVPVDHYLAEELRNMHLRLANEGDFLFISQLTDLKPDQAKNMKEQFHLDDERLDQMFEVLGRWYLSADFIPQLVGLLTEREIARAVSTIGFKPQPLC